MGNSNGDRNYLKGSRYNVWMSKQYSHLFETLNTAPRSPGVYQMKDADGATLYIGKAKSLRSRIRSYFRESANHSPRISLMVEKVCSIDVIVTASEMEALTLEDNLIKEKQPWYNVLLKDDKNYPYLKLTMDELYPRLILVRKLEKDGGRYFGPYVSAKAVRATMRLIQKIFPLRQSSDRLEGKPPRRPCLNYQMRRCLAPCAGKTTPDEYGEVVDQVTLFLKGHNDKLLKLFEEKMWAASSGERFEEAARLRDQLDAVKTLSERQSVSRTRLSEEDVIAASEKAGKAVIKIFQMRRGKMTGERSYQFDRLDKQDMPEALSAFIRQFYTGAMTIPKSIVVSEEPEGIDTLQERLSVKRGSKVEIVIPKRGERKRLLEMAKQNANRELEQLAHSTEGRNIGLSEVAERLALEETPKAIEGYDISNTGGIFATGAVVTFINGEPDKKGYRKYKIKTVGAPDDYASLAEVISRRYRRLDAEGGQFADLLVIDGGKGQVSAVTESFNNIGIEPPPIVGIAKGKKREDVATDEFYLPGRSASVYFPESSPGRFLLQRIRDEAHRFAIAYHKKLRDGAITRSSLDAIPGIGPKRKKALLKKFGSVARIREASVDTIAETLKVSEKVAKEIHERL